MTSGSEELPAFPAAVEPVAQEAAAAPAQKAVADPHRWKFHLAYVGLSLLLAGAAAGLVALLVRTDPVESAPWSEFRPVSEGLAGAQEIADYVAPRYRLATGRQLVAVRAGALSVPISVSIYGGPQFVQDAPVAGIALQGPQSEEDISFLPAQGAVQYELCGLGENCAIAEGEPTRERGRLLNREALELALYSFKYLDDVDRVVTFLPPRQGDPPTWALLFQRNDFREALDRPLLETLPDAKPPTPEKIGPRELALIDQLTEPRRFQFSFQPLPSGNFALILDRPEL